MNSFGSMENRGSGDHESVESAGKYTKFDVNDDMIQGYLAELSQPPTLSSPPDFFCSPEGGNGLDGKIYSEVDKDFCSNLNDDAMGNEEGLNEITSQSNAHLVKPDVGIEQFKQHWKNEYENENDHLLPTPHQRVESISHTIDDAESVYSSNSFQNLKISPASNLLSPTNSHFKSNDEDGDDLLSVCSGYSNYLLPVDSQGMKHIGNVTQADELLKKLDDMSLYLDLERSNAFAPTSPVSSNIPQELILENLLDEGSSGLEISGQTMDDFGADDKNYYSPTSYLNNDELVDNELTRNDFLLSQIPTINVDNNASTIYQNQPTPLIKIEDATSPNLDEQIQSTVTSDLQHEEMRQGRIAKRRTPRSRNSSRSRQRSMSPESKARSLSENRKKLLEMADLSPVSIKQEFIEDHELKVESPLEDGETPQNLSGTTRRKLVQKHPSVYACSVCDKKFTRPYNLKSHQRTHTNDRPFACKSCGRTFAREHDRKRHEDLHSGKKRYVCGGVLRNGDKWGCGKRFARSDALGRHFKTESGKRCITPLYEEASKERNDPN